MPTHSDGTKHLGLSNDPEEPRAVLDWASLLEAMSSETNLLSNYGTHASHRVGLKITAVMLYCSKELVVECYKPEPNVDAMKDSVAQALDKIVDLTAVWQV
jgi:hypothetical protein